MKPADDPTPTMAVTAGGPPRVYLDWNATTPPHPDVLAAMMAAARTAWGNPASIHGDGRAARAVVEDTRAEVARISGFDPRDVVLTSGATEANNLALQSAVAAISPERAQAPGASLRGDSVPLIVTSRLEHPSITKTAEALEREGRARVHWLSILPDGRVDPYDARRILAAGAAVVALQAVNHETGVVQPVAEVAEWARQARAWLHVDAVQAIGRVNVDLQAVDSWSIASHKIRGPKGIGALAIGRGRVLRPILFGGSQERGTRPGTVDAVAAAGFGVALRRARSTADRYARLGPLRDALEAYLEASFPGTRIQGRSAPQRAPHVVNCAFGGGAFGGERSATGGGPELVAALDLEGISVSSGSACSAGTVEPSPVVLAMAGKDVAARAIRISMGEDTTEADLGRFKDALGRIAARLAHAP